jgi:CelD/BcsL family acetyltransferase involved in cellulose biosynthesis/glycosyltransferase involved in cell wall biosynthesis
VPGDSTAGGRRAAFSFDALSSNADLARVEPEWLELFERSATRNPFAHPAWIRAWLATFARAHDALVVTARRGGELVGVAPFYRRSYGVGPTSVTCLHVAGSSVPASDPLTEMSEILTLDDGRRRIIRALLNHVAQEHASGIDWLGLCLPPWQGWFDDEWLPEQWQARGAFAIHKDVRPFVVLPLPGSWEQLTLKRNLKEAIRRSKNRLAALDSPTEIVFAEGEAAARAIERIQELHSSRAVLRGHLDHDDYFATDAVSRFARTAATGLAATGHAAGALLTVGDTAIAGRVVLRAGGGAFLSFSGADPEHWALGASTALIVACIRRAIEQGDRSVNFSINPDGAKLRWSEEIEQHNEFLVVGPSRRAQRAFDLFWQMRAHRALARRKAVQRQRYAATHHDGERSAESSEDRVTAASGETANVTGGTTAPFSIVCFSPLDWDAELPTNRQQIMARAARRGHDVLFVETGAFLGVQLMRLLRGPRRLSLLRRLVGTEKVAPGIKATKALNLMPWGQRYERSNRLNGRISAILIRSRSRRLKKPRVVWLYDPRATWAIGQSGDEFAVYDCVDDYAEQAEGARNRALIAAADRIAAESSRVVFATTRPLEERHRRANPNTHLVPNVGDFELFHDAVDRETARADLRELPRPVYGFAGNLLPGKVDLDLLEDFAGRIDGGTLLLAGPTRGAAAERIARLTTLPCVRTLGPVPYPEMPSVVAAFDVALIPYAENEYTRSCFPLKLYEYLAAGKPAIATGLPELRGMEPDVVVASGRDEFAEAAVRALGLVSQEDVDRRVALASRNTWDVRTERLLGLVAAEL